MRKLVWLIIPAILVGGLVIAIRAQAGRADFSAYPWLYVRDGLPPAAGEKLVEIVVVGDVMLGRGVAGQPGVFDRAAGWLRAADLLVGNYEGTIGTAAPPGASLSAPPEAAFLLRQAGFDLLGLANNHSLESGQAGLSETAAHLETAGIRPLDARLTTLEVKSARLAFLACNAVPPLLGEEDIGCESIEETLRSAHTQAGLVVVLVHWGLEYQRHPSQAQRALAARLFEAGADVIIGSHPHVTQDLRFWTANEAPGGSSGADEGARLVAYSLGNFVFDQGGEDVSQGMALRLLLDQGGLRAAQALPVWAGLRPGLMVPGEASALLERILPVQRQGFACSPQGCTPVDAPQDASTGAFFSGAIDLTGDGAPEIVRRQGASATIYQDGELAWQSPPEWQVLDLALGDPNDDGRSELLLALAKPDSEGRLASHPFILGHRGGTYRLLWGGSAVSDPIQEVELGDVDADGAQELVAIEAPAMRQERYITVWDWHGWGFSLVWRSPPGEYRDLSLVRTPTGRLVMSVVNQP